MKRSTAFRRARQAWGASCTKRTTPAVSVATPPRSRHRRIGFWSRTTTTTTTTHRPAEAKLSNNNRNLSWRFSSSTRRRRRRPSTAPAPGGNSLAARIQWFIDYGNTVFSNGDLNATLVLAGSEPLPTSVATTSYWDIYNDEYVSPVLDSTLNDSNAAHLRSLHEADVVVALHTDSRISYCGEADVWTRGQTVAHAASRAYSFVNTDCLSNTDYLASTVTHEIGHNLGLQHDPDHTSVTPSRALYAYAFGHIDLVNDVHTVMSYGSDSSTRTPYFSTAARSPNGWTLGIAGSRENERAMRNSLGDAATWNDFIPLPAPTGLSATTALSGTTASVSLTWTDRSRHESGYSVEYRTWLDANWTVAATLAPDVTQAMLTGLEPAKRYVFRVGAIPTQGTAQSTQYSTEVSVRTPGDGPPTGPGPLSSVDAVDFKSIIVVWSDNALVETSYEVQFRSGNASWSAFASLPSGSTTATITGLRPDTLYEVRVGAKNARGVVWSEIGSARTLVVPPPAAPADLYGSTLSPTSARLNWRDEASTETSYEVHIRAPGDTSWTTHQSLPPDTDATTVTGLTANSTVEFRVAAILTALPYDEFGASYSSTLTVDLSVTPPTMVLSTDIYRDFFTDNVAVDLSWTATGDPSSIHLEQRDVGGSWNPYQTVNGSTRSHTVNDLDEGGSRDVYSFRLVAENAGGRGRSNEVHVDLRKVYPREPSALKITRTGPTELRVEWDDNSDSETGIPGRLLLQE